MVGTILGGLGRVALACVLALALLIAPRPALAASAGSGTAAATSTGCGTPGIASTTIYLPNITKTLGGPTGWVTPFIVQNVGVHLATLEVSFYRFTDGGLVTCRRIDGLAPSTSFADYPNADADLPGDTQFAVVVRSFGSEAVAVVNEHQGRDTRAEALSYDGLKSGATTLYLPFVAKLSASWNTPFVVQDLGVRDTTVTARFVASDGTTVATLTRTIAPGRSRFVDPRVEGTVAEGAYAVVLASTEPIGAIVNVHDDAPSMLAPRAFSYTGIPQPERASVYVPYVRRPDAVTERSYPNGVLIQNAGTTSATPTLTFQRLGGGGGVVLTAPAPIAPGATWRFDPSTAASLASGEDSLVVDGGTFAVLAPTITDVDAMAYVGSTGAGNRAYLPNITRTLGGANGWTTPIVIQSSGATSATLRWYRFSDGTLITRQPLGPLVRGAAVQVDPRAVPGLADDTQYGVVVDAQGGGIAAIVTERSFQGGDGTMAYEGFAATVPTVRTPTVVTITPRAIVLGTDESAQLAAIVKDQFDGLMPDQVPSWSVTGPIGSVDARGLLTAGGAAGTGTVTATAGDASETAPVTVVAPTAVTQGGISFLLRTTGPADVYTDAALPHTDAGAIATQVSLDVSRVETDYGRHFERRPQVYVTATDAAYATVQVVIMGLPQASVTSPILGSRFDSAGLYYGGRIAIDWPRAAEAEPFTVARHELTHEMIDEISRGAAVPAWLNEGSARLEEFTIPGATWWEVLNRERAVSMAVNQELFSTTQLTSQSFWNTRAGYDVDYQYAEASQLVRVVRDQIGIGGEILIMSLMGTGVGFEDAFAAVSGQEWSQFDASIPARIAALSVSPGIAFAPDSITGTGGEGPTFVLYGFAPSSIVDLRIVGTASGATNTQRLTLTDPFGVYWSRLGTSWPSDTYVFTVTLSDGQQVTAHVTKGG